MNRLWVHSAPHSTDTTVWMSTTRGRPGMMPASRCSTRGWVAPVAATEQPSQDAPTIQIRYTFSSGPRRILDVSGSTARERIPMGAIGSRGFWRQSTAWPLARTTSPLPGRLPDTPPISDPAGNAPPWVIEVPPLFSFVLDLREVGRPLPPPAPELPVAIRPL